jgi:hypothetical protein
MTAARLIAEAEAAGVRLRLEPDGRVRVAAEHEPPAALLATLREHKAEVVALLRAEPPGWREPAASLPPWHDDREWIACWCAAGATLAERKPVLEAWLAAAPPPPLPRRLHALELARIARNYGIVLEVEP